MTIHHWHVDVHENELVAFLSGFAEFSTRFLMVDSIFDEFQSHFAIGRRVRFQAKLLEDALNRKNIGAYVVNH